jgi:hypothetical protein
MHGFLVLESGDKSIIAVGDQTNVVHGNEIYSRLVFHFRDGSIDEETTVFRQSPVFQLVKDHHIQKGPSFPKPVDMTIDVPTGQVSWQSITKGKTETEQQHMDLPDDLANGLISLLIDDFPANTNDLKVSYVAIDSKPRVVKLFIHPDGIDKTLIGGRSRQANRFNVHIELGGVAGVVAPVIGKQPKDIKLWVLDGEVPTFIKMVGPLYEQGPIWTMLLTAPRWPQGSK